MKLIFVGFFIFAAFPCSFFAKPNDLANLPWGNEIPRIIHPDKQLVELYESTWKIASNRVRIGPAGLPASPYLDENCYEDQIWIWDSCFMVMFSKYAPKAFPGKETLTNLYAPIHDKVKTPLKIHLRDNPPLFAWAEYEICKFSGDSSRANFVLNEKKYLQRHFDFFNSVPKGHKDDSSPQPIFRDVVREQKSKEIVGFIWTGGASGMDNTPRGRDVGGFSKIMWIDAISQQALSALYISRMAGTLNLKDVEVLWRERYEGLKKIINERYWDELDGFYYDVEIATGKPCKIKTMASFWPMLAEIPSREQAAKMIKFLRDEKCFGGERPLPTLDRRDKDFNAGTGDYWRGGIWLPTSYMAIKALEKYGEFELADSMAKRIVELQKRTYFNFEPHTIWECYSPGKDSPSTEHGRRARPDFCGWSALGPISLVIENVLGFRNANGLTGTLVWDLKIENGTHGIKNLRFGKICADLVYDSYSKSVSVNTNLPFVLILNGKSLRVSDGVKINLGD